MRTRHLLITAGVLLAIFGTVSATYGVASEIVNNNLKLYGRAFNPSGYFTVSDNMVITKKLNVQGNVSDSKGTLTLDDDVAVTGDTIMEGGAEIKGEIFNSNDSVTVNDDLTVTGTFSINSMPSPDTTACDTSGALSYDPTYLYLCADNTWKKIPLQSL